jgi:hypothetical protein
MTFVPLDAASFLPEHWVCDSSQVSNFNWEVFGIERMARVEPDEPTREIWPCEDGWPHLTTGFIPGVDGWVGRLDNIFFVTAVRGDMGVPVHKIYTTVPLDAEGLPGAPDCSARWVGVYVPTSEHRGGAAYIAVPPGFFISAEVTDMIRRLLDVLGEPRIHL